MPARVTQRTISVDSSLVGGRQVFTIGGLPVHVRARDESPFDAAIRQCARIARNEFGDDGFVSVVFAEEGEPGATYAVRGDGYWEPVEEGHPQAQLVDRERPEAPAGLGRTRHSATQGKRTPIRKRGGHLILPIALAVVAGGLGGGAYLGYKESAMKRPHAPMEYERKALWVDKDLTGEVSPLVRDGRVYSIAQNGTVLRAQDLVTGDEIWTQELAGDVRARAVSFTSTDEGDRIAVPTDHALNLFDPQNGSRRAMPLPAGAEVRMGGQAPLVGVSRGRVAIIRQGQLVDVAVPSGMVALGASRQGTVTAAGPSGWAHIRPGDSKPQIVPWQKPTRQTAARAQPDIAGYAGSRIVTVWPVESSGRAQIGVYDDLPWGVSFSFRAPIASVGAGQKVSWRSSPSGTWGVMGGQLVDLPSGETQVIGDLKDVALGDKQGCATIDGSRVIFGPGRKPGLMGGEEECLTASDEEVGIVASSGEMYATRLKGEE